MRGYDSELRDLEARLDGEDHMSSETLESFVDGTTAAEFLALKPRRVLELARAGDLPAYPLGQGVRRVWRFRLSELAAALKQIPAPALVYGTPETRYRSKPAKRSAGSK